MTAEVGQMALFAEAPRLPGDAATQHAVLDLVAAGRYALLPADVVLDTRDTVWIDGDANWCYLGLPDGHLPVLTALADHDLIAPAGEVRAVRLADQPVQVTRYRLTTAGRALLAVAA